MSAPRLVRGLLAMSRRRTRSRSARCQLRGAIFRKPRESHVVPARALSPSASRSGEDEPFRQRCTALVPVKVRSQGVDGSADEMTRAGSLPEVRQDQEQSPSMARPPLHGRNPHPRPGTYPRRLSRLSRPARRASAMPTVSAVLSAATCRLRPARGPDLTTFTSLDDVVLANRLQRSARALRERAFRCLCGCGLPGGAPGGRRCAPSSRLSCSFSRSWRGRSCSSRSTAPNTHWRRTLGRDRRGSRR